MGLNCRIPRTFRLHIVGGAYDLRRCASPTSTYANYDIVGEPTTYDVTRIPRTLSEVEVYSVEPTTYDVLQLHVHRWTS